MYALVKNNTMYNGDKNLSIDTSTIHKYLEQM